MRICGPAEGLGGWLWYRPEHACACRDKARSLSLGVPNLVSEVGGLCEHGWAEPEIARVPPNITFDRTAGSHSLAAGGQRAR
jgi:hypothetical protein